MNIQEQCFTCKKCGESKIWGEFVKSHDCKFGIVLTCLLCQKKRQKEYYESNSEKIKARTRKYAIENREKVLKNGNDYYKNNKHVIAEKAKIFREKNRERLKDVGAKYRAKQGVKERCKATNAEYRKKNADRLKVEKAEYYKKNIDRLREKGKKYRADNPDRDKIFKEKNPDYSIKNYHKHRDKISARRSENRRLNAHRYKEREKKQRDSLCMPYVRTTLRMKGFTREQITENPELINIQRIIIKTKRLCKT